MALQKITRTAMIYDISRFKKITFYLKGSKSKTFFSRPNRVYIGISCYGEKIESRYGKYAMYYNKTTIIPDKKWIKIEIPRMATQNPPLMATSKSPT